MNLANKVAIITGAASGIGKAAARLFAEQGASVIIADINEEQGNRVKEEIKTNGHQAEYIQTDVSQASEIKHLVDRTVEQYGRIDILYNNAGIAQTFVPMESIDDEMVDQLLAVNVKGPFLGCKYVIPIMKKQQSGNILFTASMTGVRPLPETNLYATTKGAVITMAKALALELAKDNIRVNSIAPVAVKTPMMDDFVQGGNREEEEQQIAARFPIKRLVTPEEVAKAALYLVSEDARMITGSVLQLDGGRGI